MSDAPEGDDAKRTASSVPWRARRATASRCRTCPRIREFQGNNCVLPLKNPLDLAPIEEVEKRYILEVLQALNGSRKRAAISLGIDRRTLHRRLKAYGVVS